MSKDHNGRRRIFRRDAGRAFLRFLIGEVLLVVLCSVFYLFVLQGKVDIELPLKTAEPTIAAQPTAGDGAAAEATQSAAPDATVVPTIEPTAEATQEPTEAPTATPIPAEALNAQLIEPVAGLQPQCDPLSYDPSLKAGIREMTLFDDADQNVVTLRAYAYIEGADAAVCARYLVVLDVGSGDTVAVYAADPASDEADLAFDGAAGQNLDQAFFKINLDTSSLPDGVYLLAAAVRSGDKTTWSYFDDAISHFDIEQGVARLTSR